MREIKEVEYDETDCFANDEAKCPYCGHKCELIGEDYGAQDEEQEMQCFECDKTFIYTTDYSVTFSTEPYENWILREIKNSERQLRNLKDDMEKAPDNRKQGLDKEYYKWRIETEQKNLETLKNKAERALREVSHE